MPRAARPVQEPERAGQQLGGGDEADQPEAGEGLLALDDAVEAVARRHDGRDGQSARAQDAPVHVPARVGAAPRRGQGGGKQQVVRHHGRQCKRGDNDHGARRRQPAQEDGDGQPVASEGERDAQHVEIGGTFEPERAAREQDGHDGQVQQQQVQRKQPVGRAQLSVVLGLDERHVVLARQQERRGEGQQQERRPRALARGRVQRGHLVRSRGAPRGEPRRRAEHAVHHERERDQQRTELDGRLERDRHDEAPMLLARRQVAGTEEDGEARDGDAETECRPFGRHPPT